jgi:ABC-2 type transport system ATP-binding protein
VGRARELSPEEPGAVAAERAAADATGAAGSVATRRAEPAAPPDPTAAGEAVLAESLGLRTRRGWVFRDVTMAVPANALVVVHGPAGSGRSMLLLALAGRAAPTTGRLVVAGAGRPAAIRRRAAVARVSGAVELEPELTVGEHVRERALLEGVDRADLIGALDLLGVRAPADREVGDLDPADAALLAVALACAGDPALVVADDVDARVDPADRDRLWTGLQTAARGGPAVVVTALDPAPGAARGAQVLDLTPSGEE